LLDTPTKFVVTVAVVVTVAAAVAWEAVVDPGLLLMLQLVLKQVQVGFDLGQISWIAPHPLRQEVLMVLWCRHGE